MQLVIFVLRTFTCFGGEYRVFIEVWLAKLFINFLYFVKFLYIQYSFSFQCNYRLGA